MNFSYLIFTLAFYFAAVDGKALHSIQSKLSGYVHYAEPRLWLKLHQTPATWREARITCFEEGAMLAAPENEALLDLMNHMISSSSGISHVFTGISDVLATGVFMSIEGTSLNKMPVSWAPSKLYFLDTETCLSMHRDGILADNQCTDKLPFICYKKDPVTLSCGPKGNGYEIDRTTGSCYKFHKESKYWRDAYVACHQEDAHLAIINSYGEAAVLKDLFISNVLFRNPYGKKLRDVVHMGFVNWGREDGLWMTIDGQTLKEAGYEEWNTGEPNNKTNQWCGGMFDNGKLDDVNCGDGDPDQYSRYFICEKKPEYIYTLASETIDNESVNSNYYEYDFDY